MRALRLFFLLVVSTTSLEALIPFNITLESDPMLNSYFPEDRKAMFVYTFEHVYATHGFMATHDFDVPLDVPARGSVLQLWQKQQDAIAALKSFGCNDFPEEYAQELFRDDDNGTHGIYTPYADLEVPFNMVFGGRVRIPHNLIFTAYIPFRSVSLKNIRWCGENPQQTFEQITTPPLIALCEELGHINLTKNWTRTGFGDLITRVEGYRSFPQMRPWLRMVNINLRSGLRFPTGLKTDNSKLLALPFGFDQGMGIFAGGRLELCYPHGMVLGIDGELLHLFGNMRQRRIKTNAMQTDLLFLTQTAAYVSPGFMQSFTLFLEKIAQGGGFLGRLSYEYNKQIETTTYPCANIFDVGVVNSAESLQEWTAHGLTLTLGYDWCYRSDMRAVPSIAVFGTYGFNGKRSLVASTIGFTCNVAF